MVGSAPFVQIITLLQSKNDNVVNAPKTCLCTFLSSLRAKYSTDSRPPSPVIISIISGLRDNSATAKAA